MDKMMCDAAEIQATAEALVMCCHEDLMAVGLSGEEACHYLIVGGLEILEELHGEDVSEIALEIIEAVKCRVRENAFVQQ